MAKQDDIELWDVKRMLEEARKRYPLLDEKLKYNCNEETYITQIERILKKHGFVKQRDSSDTGKEKYRVSNVIAEFIIDDLLCDYFSQGDTKTSENARKRNEKRKKQNYKKVLNEVEKKSKRLDEEANKVALFEKEIGYYDLPEQLYTEEEIEQEKEILEKMEKIRYYHKLSTGKLINKESLSYKLPVTYHDEITDEKINAIIDRMMLRAVFDMFFKFDEETFRADLYERAERTFSDGTIPMFLDGYSELTRKLENPLRNYISLKKIKKNEI